jgi:hypothetical protein
VGDDDIRTPVVDEILDDRVVNGSQVLETDFAVHKPGLAVIQPDDMWLSGAREEDVHVPISVEVAKARPAHGDRREGLV